jgi:hypothetical protein
MPKCPVQDMYSPDGSYNHRRGRNRRQRPSYRVKHVAHLNKGFGAVNLYQQALEEQGMETYQVTLPELIVRMERVSEVNLRNTTSASSSPTPTTRTSHRTIAIEGLYTSEDASPEILAELNCLSSELSLELEELFEPHAVICLTPRDSEGKSNGNLLASKAAVVAQLKEPAIGDFHDDSMDETIEYKAKVEKLGSELRKAQSESKHYQQLAHKLKADLGALLKRSFGMLREARDKASSYKQQLEELQKERSGENGRNRDSSLSSQGSNDLEILSMASNNSGGRGRVYTPPPILPPAAMTFADMPGAPWWSQPPTGVHHLFDEFDEKVEQDSDAERALRHQQHRRTIGPAEIAREDAVRSTVPFDAFDKYLFV